MASRLSFERKTLGEHLKITTGHKCRISCSRQLQYGRILFRMGFDPLQPVFAKKIVDGNIDDLNAALYEELLAKIDHSVYVNKSLRKYCS
jgi:hypothetical protein